MNFSNQFQLQILSTDNSILKKLHLFFVYVLKKNKIFNLRIQQIYFPVKIKKFTLLKSPHIFKTARIQIETRFLKSMIILSNFKKNVEITKIQKILVTLIKNLPTNIKLKLKTFKLLYI